MYKLHTKCRACGSVDLKAVVDFGFQPLANDFKEPTGDMSGAAPLKVLYCRKCSLAQLSVVVDPHVLYDHYCYVTSTSKTMFEHFGKLRDDLKRERGGELGKVLEIGSNDGALLEFLRPDSVMVFGVDPAQNLCELAMERGVSMCNDLWSQEVADTLPKFDTIIARHVFAHCDDWQDFVRGLEMVTHENSVVAIEMPYAGDLLAGNEFDTIYHEHMSFATIKSMNALLANSSLYLSNVIRYTIHGGTLVMVLKARKPGCVPVVDDDIKEEQWVWLDGKAREMLQAFRSQIKYLNGMKNNLCGYGATAKSALWLNCCGLRKNDLLFIHDVTKQKQGKLAPGTDIPIIDGSQRMSENITHAVLFAWNFAEEILKKETELRKKGVSFIVPVPTLSVIPPL